MSNCNSLKTYIHITLYGAGSTEENVSIYTYMNAIIMEEEAVNVKQSWEAYMGGFGRRESKAEKKLYFNVKKKNL